MTETEERRAQGAKRVHLSTLVEICGNEPGIPAFEAEALDVSGRGMHMRTAYLPELGAPLVCRFEDQGREILVEGVVAWRREGGRGGEFGLQFTALDSGSVDALTELCGATQAAAERAPTPARESGDEGARVRLHIEGLGSPMKARVRSGGERQIQVGSNLEFLKVGRRLEIEDVEGGDKRNARIEGVSVAIDARTRIPQLVVVLRYDDAPETTPEPSVIDAHATSSAAPPAHPDAPAPAAQSRLEHERSAPPQRAEPSSAVDEETGEPEDELRGKLGQIATRAGAAMQQTTSRLVQLGSDASAGLTRLLRDARARRSGDDRATEDKPRRTTHIPPAPSGEARRLRPQSASARVSDEGPAAGGSAAKRRRIKQLASAGAAIGLLATVSVIAMQGGSPPPGAETAGARAPAARGLEAPAEPTTATPEKTPAVKSGPQGGISADVPLFGPTPMATMEPAPLGPAPEPAAVKAPAPELPPTLGSPAGIAERDETFEDEPDRDRKPNPSEVEPWGRGKIRTPIVHRLRLDAPGFALQGAITPTGFAVVVPERKIMEPGASIAQRDKRIARVQTKNLGSGAQVTFQFRNGVPGYRVRLRKDYIEFLISADEKSAARETDSASGSSRRSSKAKEGSSRAESRKDGSSRGKRDAD
jgi:hypothetical protein